MKDSVSDSRRHGILPDVQLKPGDSLDHVDWAAQAFVEYKPDVIVVIGDFGDIPSLSAHEKAGSIHTVGASIQADIDIFNEGMRRLTGPIDKEVARLARKHRRKWRPEKHFLFGNHEHRITRVVSDDPKFAGVLGLDLLETPGWTRHEFLKIVNIDGIKYCHYFPNPYSGKAIGGTIVNRLNHIGASFVQGHQQGFLHGEKQYPDHVKHGIVCGRYYAHHEHYRPTDVQRAEWNGIIILNQVKDGDFDIMPLRFDYLKRKYGR
jgi:hypothetical protein